MMLYEALALVKPALACAWTCFMLSVSATYAFMQGLCKRNTSSKIWGSQSVIATGSDLQGCFTSSTGQQWPTFRRILVLSYSVDTA